MVPFLSQLNETHCGGDQVGSLSPLLHLYHPCPVNRTSHFTRIPVSEGSGDPLGQYWRNETQMECLP